MKGDNYSSRLKFIFSTILFIIILFILGHVGLVNLYKLGRIPTIGMAFVLTILIVIMFIWQKKHRFFPLVVGLMLWAVLGEITEYLQYGDIVNIKNVFLLSSIIAFIFYLVYKNLLSDFLTITIVFFLIIWASHFILISLFEQLGKTHILTYLSYSIFLVIFIYAIFKTCKSDNRLEITIQIIFITCSFWSLLEYLRAWQLIPKPW